MSSGPFTTEDQWGVSGIDPFECKRMMKCFSSKAFQRELAKRVPTIMEGYGDPNGVVEACRSTTYYDITNSNAPVRWFKTTTSGNTGWI